MTLEEILQAAVGNLLTPLSNRRPGKSPFDYAEDRLRVGQPNAFSLIRGSRR
jgi:hypothetical protein